MSQNTQQQFTCRGRQVVELSGAITLFICKVCTNLYQTPVAHIVMLTTIQRVCESICDTNFYRDYLFLFIKIKLFITLLVLNESA